MQRTSTSSLCPTFLLTWKISPMNIKGSSISSWNSQHNVTMPLFGINFVCKEKWRLTVSTHSFVWLYSINKEFQVYVLCLSLKASCLCYQVFLLLSALSLVSIALSTQLVSIDNLIWFELWCVVCVNVHSCRHTHVHVHSCFSEWGIQQKLCLGKSFHWGVITVMNSNAHQHFSHLPELSGFTQACPKA